MNTTTTTPRGRGRPPTGKTPREHQVLFYVTDEDGIYLEKLSKRLGFRSRSQMFTALTERLIIGGFSGLVFAKLGWQFAGLIAKSPQETSGMYFGVRPLPPLIGDEDDPTGAEIVPFLKEITAEAKKEQYA